MPHKERASFPGNNFHPAIAFSLLLSREKRRFFPRLFSPGKRNTLNLQ
jgi:hypothetical protein